MDVNVQVLLPKVNDQGKTVSLVLVSPNGARVELLHENFRPDGVEMLNTVFDDEASVSAWEGSAPFLGSYRPNQPLDMFDGLDATGEWTLEIEWIWAGKPDRLESWSLDITRFNTPSAPQAPTVESLTASPDPVGQGSLLTLTADNVDDSDGYIAQVVFYRDANGNGVLEPGFDTLVGTDTDGGDGWSVETSTGSLALGNYTYFAQAIDNTGLTSNIVADTAEVIDSPSSNANNIYVWDIGFSSKTRGKSTDYRIEIDVNRDSNEDALAGSSDAPASEVLVTVELRDDSGSLVDTYTGMTDSNGVFRSNWIRGLDAGTYRAEVVDMVHATFDWNHFLDPTLLDNDYDDDGLPDDQLII